jgi:lipooligosaccharide transport system permease protein
MNVSVPHALSVWRRNATMYGRTWMYNLLPNFFEPVLYLVAIGIGVGAYVSQMGGVSYSQFLAPGLVCVAAMNGASFEVTYNIFVRLTYDKAYDAMLTTPVEPDDVLAGEILWAVTRSCIYGGAFFIVLVLFGLAPLPWALAAIPVIPLSGLLFASIGVAFTMRVPTIDLFSFYFTLFLTPLFLFSDVFFPLQERLSGVWLWIAEVLPLLHPVRLARHAFRGELLAPIVVWDLIYILGLSALLLRWSVNAARRRLTS